MLRSARLSSEPLSTAHLEEIWPWEADDRVARWLWPGQLGGARTREQTLRTLEVLAAEARPDGMGWRLWRDATGAAVARGGLRRCTVDGRPEVELGWLVDPDRWGQGYATELALASVAHAFGPLELRRVVAFTLPHNEASRRVMRKAGLEFEKDIVHAGLPHVLYARPPG